MPDQLRINGSIVTALRGSLRDGEHGLKCVPALLKRVLKEEMWRDRIIEQTGKRVAFKRFEEFVSKGPPAGLGASMVLIRNIVRDDPVALDLLDSAMKAEDGNPTGKNQYNSGTVDNVHSSLRPNGNSSAAALRRLRKDRPDLHAEVVAGKKSPHAAMIEAGFRKKPTAFERAKADWQAMTKPERQKFILWIGTQ